MLLTKYYILRIKQPDININTGMNEQIKEKCPALKQYMQYVDMVREYNKETSLKDAVIKSVDESCQIISAPFAPPSCHNRCRIQ